MPTVDSLLEFTRGAGFLLKELAAGASPTVQAAGAPAVFRALKAAVIASSITAQGGGQVRPSPERTGRKRAQFWCLKAATAAMRLSRLAAAFAACVLLVSCVR